MLADQPHVSIPEAARRLGAGESTVRRWIRTGRLSAITMPSGRRRVPVASIESVLTVARGSAA